jgi:hypothetical protein
MSGFLNGVRENTGGSAGMNVNSGGPHILLFERDQQLTALLSGELGLAGYEVHTSRTAVEVFDAIARYPIRLVMVNLAQAQAGRHEFWVALDAQRRGRGVQVFTFRCSNVGGYGVDDPEEHIQTVPTDMEVEGMQGIVRLVEAVRVRVPGATSVTSTPSRPAQGQSPSILEASPAIRPVEAPQTPPVQSTQANTVVLHAAQPSPGYLRPQPPLEAPAPAPVPPPPARQAEPQRTGHSTFTDKIRAVIYPGSRNFSTVPETSWGPQNAGNQTQSAGPYQASEVQPRPQASQRFAEADYTSAPPREESSYQPSTPVPNQQIFSSQTNTSHSMQTSGGRASSEESGLDQLSRLLRESQPALAPMGGGSPQNAASQPALAVDPQQIQEFQAQLLQAVRMDEAYGRSNTTQQRSGETLNAGDQLRASPIQDVPFEREIEKRRSMSGGLSPQMAEPPPRPGLTIFQPTQAMPPVQQGASGAPRTFAGQAPTMDARAFPNGSGAHVRPLSPIREASPEPPPIITALGSQSGLVQEVAARSNPGVQITEMLGAGESATLEQMQANLQQIAGRRPEIKPSEDTLLDIVKSLPPMAPAPQPPQVQVLSGRATRSLGSVLLEGHLVPQERLQVAQHVQRMLRGVDLNYQLGEILLMFKLLTPDQLLAASLVSYGMISTIQISALGRIRQELHAIGLEYDLESLLVLFRILTPEQLREVRASWSS